MCRLQGAKLAAKTQGTIVGRGDKSFKDQLSNGGTSSTQLSYCQSKHCHENSKTTQNYHIHVGVSKNSVKTPKWMVYNGKSLLKWMIWGGKPLFSETPIVHSLMPHLWVDKFII